MAQSQRSSARPWIPSPPHSRHSQITSIPNCARSALRQCLRTLATDSFQPAVATAGRQSLIAYEKISSSGLSRIGARFVEANVFPIITVSEGEAEFIEGADPIRIDANIQITDPDSPNFEAGTLRVEIIENRDLQKILFLYLLLRH